jgi:hypothetical protein
MGERMIDLQDIRNINPAVNAIAIEVLLRHLVKHVNGFK